MAVRTHSGAVRAPRRATMKSIGYVATRREWIHEDHNRPNGHPSPLKSTPHLGSPLQPWSSREASSKYSGASLSGSSCVGVPPTKTDPPATEQRSSPPKGLAVMVISPLNPGLESRHCGAVLARTTDTRSQRNVTVRGFVLQI